MLSAKLPLHDIQDVEAFVASIVERRNFDLSWHDQEDLLAFLVETCWELSRQRPAPWRDSFSGWVYPYLRQRTVDWQRQRNGRTKWQFKDKTYERDIPVFVPLDDRPDDAEYVEPVDVGAYSDSVARRVLRERDSTLVGGDNTVGAGTARQAA